MKTINIFVDNYKVSTQGFNAFGKAVVIFVVALIFFTIISAFVNLFLTL